MLKLPDHLREELRKPFGKVYKEFPDVDGYIVTVGDIVTKSAIEKGVKIKLAIYDLKTKRNIPVKINYKFKKTFKVCNPPGYISDEAIEKIKYISQLNDDDIGLYVEGEEDLLALLVIKYFPKNIYVAYGLPDKGVILLKIDDELKKKIDEILKKFEKVKMMNIKIVSERYNPLAHRKEIRFIVDHEGATPTFKDVKLKLAAMLNVNKELLIVESIYQETGLQRVRGYAKVYDNEEFLKYFEREHIIRKNQLEEEQEQEG
ncbi:Protein of unknown function DUF359 [Methanocaldococcus infernus ME]|uniref:Multifunctional fusion protein n=2 Tax=Methanocaldococcus infernus TaxID=67760 RepID=D5VT18_METIM|nr:Protein of unknown function DUF359 [Methanocaldococcus infernus ME]